MLKYESMKRVVAIIALLACVSCCGEAALAAEISAAACPFLPGQRLPCVPKRVKVEQPLVRKVAAQSTVPVNKFAEYKAKFLARGEKNTNRVDVLIAFDRSALRWLERNGYADQEEFAAVCLDRMNQVLVNSELDGFFTFRLVGSPVVDIDVTNQYAACYADGWEYTEFGDVLDDVAGETPSWRKDSAWRNVKDPAWKALRQVREQTCADVVSILVDSRNEGTVGLAWALDATSIKTLDYFSDLAYSICSIEAVSKDSTQVHEIGHLMGAGHSDEMDPEVYGEAMLGPQLFPYSSGHYFKTAGPRWDEWHYTVMGYNYPGWEEKDPLTGEMAPIFAYEEPCFSSPDLSYDYGDTSVAAGDSAHDNARTLRETYAIVANFRVRRPYLTVLAPCGGGTVEGSGPYDPGKKTTLKAKPSAGHVFAGWYAAFDGDTGEFSQPLESAVDYRTLSLPYVVDGDATVYARFATAEEDGQSLSLVDEGETFEVDGGEVQIQLQVDSLSVPKVSVKGLPPGLKFDAKTLKITGTPSKPGVYAVVASLSNSTVKKAVAQTFAIKVPNFTTEMFRAAGLDTDGKYVLQAGVLNDALANVVNAVVAGGWTLKIDGLPAGVKFDAKKNVFSGVATKEGFCTVTFTATKGSGKTAEKEIATATFEVVFPTLKLEVAAWRDEAATNKATVAGGGRYPAGKKVALKATPAKGNVFMGWYDEDGVLVSRSASYSCVTTDGDVTFTAKFVTSEEDKASVSLSVNGAEIAAASQTQPCRTNVMCGVAMNWQIAADALSETTIKAAGLPAGLKFTAKPVTAKVGSGTTAVVVTNVPANTVYDAPTAASKVGKDGTVTPSKVVFTVTTAGKSTRTFAIDLYVEALPQWAVGTFDGAVLDAANVPTGIVQALTIAANGKIGGKLLCDGQAWTLSASSFDTVRRNADAASGQLPDGKGPTFVATVLGKCGKLMVTNEVEVSAGTMPVPYGGNDGSIRYGVAACGEWKAWQNLWKRSDTKARMPAVTKNIEVALGNGLKLTIKKDGVVAFAGMVDGTKVSGSSQLVWAGRDDSTVPQYMATLYVPKTSKFGGYSACVRLAWRDGKFVEE